MLCIVDIVRQPIDSIFLNYTVCCSETTVNKKLKRTTNHKPQTSDCSCDFIENCKKNTTNKNFHRMDIVDVDVGKNTRTECAICLEEADKENLKCRKCVYKYHRECLYEWQIISHNINCPVCGCEIDVNFKARVIIKKHSVIGFIREQMCFIGSFLVLFFLYISLTYICRFLIYFIFSNHKWLRLFFEYILLVVLASKILAYVTIVFVYTDTRHLNINTGVDERLMDFVFEQNEFNIQNWESLTFFFKLLLSTFFLCERLLSFLFL